VVAVEEREMIPEAVMTPEGDKFRIYLQSNFARSPGGQIRRRFSLAHEIAHTLFFEMRDGVMKPSLGAPRGDQLEMACQKVAAMLLVPKSLLERELGEGGEVSSADSILQLACQFEVSVEAMVRRLGEVEAFRVRFCPAVTRRSEDRRYKIEYAQHAPWLRDFVQKPRRGMDFEAWFWDADNTGSSTDGRQTEVECLIRRKARHVLTAKPVDVTGSSRIYEIQLQHADSFYR
jgi:hypothetical protein